MTRFIREGRAVVEAFERYKRVFQIGTFGRFGASRSNNSKLVHKIMRSGVLDPNPCVHIKKGGLKSTNGVAVPDSHPKHLHQPWTGISTVAQVHSNLTMVLASAAHTEATGITKEVAYV